MNTCCDVLSESQNAIVFRTFLMMLTVMVLLVLVMMLVLVLVPGSLQYNSHFLNILYVICL